MKKISTLLPLLLLLNAVALKAQAPAIEWQKCIGGNSRETGTCMRPAHDGGYIVVGQIDQANVDAQVTKVDATGNIQWQSSYGGSQFDTLNTIELTADGGYIMCGYTQSADGDVTGNHGDLDYWVVKIDVEGNIQWQKCFGGSGADASNAIYPDANGYIVVGYAHSLDGDIEEPLDIEIPFWIVKLDEAGNIQWQKTTGIGWPMSVKYTDDGGYILTGQGLHDPFTSDYSVYVLKLDSQGDTEWLKYFGGSSADGAEDIITTPDGGYVVTGFTLSGDGDITVLNQGGWDSWIIKLDGQGDIQWQKSLGGTQDENILHATPTSDGGVITIARTTSNDGDVAFNHGDVDAWLIKFGATGDIQWQKSLGGTQGDYLRSVFPTEDGGYIAGGSTSSNDGDVSGYHGMGDIWLVKLEGNTTGLDEASASAVLIYPNPTKDIIHFEEQFKTVEIFTIDGKKVLEANSVSSLNVSGLQSGTYILKVITPDGKVATQKIIKN